MQTHTPPRFKCADCMMLRDIKFHLHELSLFLFHLNENNIYFVVDRKGKWKNDGVANTGVMSKWLRLASQLERVEINAFMHDSSHMYCESAGDMLDSESLHYEKITTPLTRFIYVFSALEECYRFITSEYKDYHFSELKFHPKNELYFKPSMQVDFMLRNVVNPAILPFNYNHLVDNLHKVILKFLEDFSINQNIFTKNNNRDLNFGFNLVRIVRNIVAHGDFPVMDDPEYSFCDNGANKRRNLINVLSQSSRVAAINMQVLIYIFSKCDTEVIDEVGMDYLISLHKNQNFQMNMI